MKKTLIISIFMLLLATACGSSSNFSLETGVHLQSSFTLPEPIEGNEGSHTEMNYLVYLPDGYGENLKEKYPLILYLHGSGAYEHTSEFVLGHGLPQVLANNQQPDNYDFVTISPQAFTNTAWWGGRTLEMLNLLLDDVIRIYNIDPDRIYVTGVSMGGFASWNLADEYPERFAAIVSVSGSGFKDIYTLDKLLVPTRFDSCGIREIPIWAFHGGQDIIANTQGISEYIQRFEDTCEVDVEYTLYPDLGHLGTPSEAYTDPALYDWLLQQSR